MKQPLAHNVQIEEFTTPCPIIVPESMPLGKVKELMEANGIRHVPVVENNIPVGIVSDRDIKVLEQYPAWEVFPVGKVMAPNPFSVTYDAKIEDVALEMSSKKIGSALVVDEIGEIMGIFTSTDALNALVEIVRGEF